jgi:hypothetical protein
MTVTVYPMSIPPVTEIWVRQYRFLRELHTDEQLDALETAHFEGLGLSVAERDLSKTDPTLMSTNGYPVVALKAIVRGYELMKALGDRVELLSQDMGGFFLAAKACGIYGLDSTAADAEIARIKSNVLPT